MVAILPITKELLETSNKQTTITTTTTTKRITTTNSLRVWFEILKACSENSENITKSTQLMPPLIILQTFFSPPLHKILKETLERLYSMKHLNVFRVAIIIT